MKNRCVALAMMALFLGCGSNPEAGNPQRVPASAEGPADQISQSISVRAARVRRQPISTYILSNTTLESVRKVSVFSRVTAEISEIRVEEGNLVGSQQVLARLDGREIRNDFEQAQIAVDQAQLSLEQAEVRAQLSAADFQRAESLFNQKLTSRQEFDQAALTNRTDQLGYRNAQQQLEAAQARLEAARIQLEYTEIVSPFDGVITVRMVEVGQRVTANQELFSLEEFPPLWARIYVPEKSLPDLQVGQMADLRVETFPDEQFSGRIKLVSPTVDADSGTVKVTLEVMRTRGQLRPGMFGTVYIATETHPDALVLPRQSIIRERDRTHVFVIQPDNTVSKREVELGFSEETSAEVIAGLQEGDAVVTVGYETLADGYQVNVLGWEEADEATSLRADQVSSEGTVESEPTIGGESARTEREQGGRPRSADAFGPGGAPDPERLAAMMKRMMGNPEIKKLYEQRLEQDPELASDPQKQRSFFREVFSRTAGGRHRP